MSPSVAEKVSLKRYEIDGRIPPECDGRTNVRLRYRGQQYYRYLPTTGYYSHTIPPNYANWDCTNNPGFNQGHTAARSYHPGGVNFSLGDGSVRFLPDEIDMRLYLSMGSRNGDDAVSE